jgi:hypothetical protein
VEHLVQSFTQTNDSTTRKHDGTSLRLTIAQHLCQSIGSEIQIGFENHEFDGINEIQSHLKISTLIRKQFVYQGET